MNSQIVKTEEVNRVLNKIRFEIVRTPSGTNLSSNVILLLSINQKFTC